jgi:purine nucleoside permease
MNKLATATAAAALALAAATCAQADEHETRGSWGDTHHPKVMIVSMFGPEAQPWLEHLGPFRQIKVPGLSPDYPVVNCNRAAVCVMTTGMGHANAAASTMALVLSRVFDLSHTYFLIAGIAGINPEIGTVGSVGWARYLVDFGIQWEIDARELPSAWTTGYLGINAQTAAWSPGQPLPSTLKPPLDYRTEVFQLNEALLQKAYALSRGAVLSDAADAQNARAHFSAQGSDPKIDYKAATRPPSVLQCDTLAGDTWFSGTLLGQRATEWTRLVTDGKGVYCTTQQEDNATYEALKRGASLKLVDLNRIAVLRAGSDFDRPYPGQTSIDNLLTYQTQGGFTIALQNLFLAGNPLVQDIATHWPAWRRGVPGR